MSTWIDTFANMIGTIEGYFNGTSTRAVSNNNPGNLKYGSTTPNAIATDSKGFAIYSSAEQGMTDLKNYTLTHAQRGYSLNQFFGGTGSYGGYAPASDNNDPNSYASQVAKALGIDPNLPIIDQLGGSQTPNVVSSVGDGFDTSGDISELTSGIDLAGNGNTLVEIGLG